MAKLTEYKTVGESVSLAKLDGTPFTITQIEDSDYTQGGEVTEGVKITTQETFDLDGIDKPMNKFHTTRVAVVKKLKNEKLREVINSGKETLTVKCVTETALNGKDFFQLVDA